MHGGREERRGRHHRARRGEGFVRLAVDQRRPRPHLSYSSSFTAVSATAPSTLSFFRCRRRRRRRRRRRHHCGWGGHGLARVALQRRGQIRGLPVVHGDCGGGRVPARFRRQAPSAAVCTETVGTVLTPFVGTSLPLSSSSRRCAFLIEPLAALLLLLPCRRRGAYPVAAAAACLLVAVVIAAAVIVSIAIVSVVAELPITAVAVIGVGATATRKPGAFLPPPL